MEAALTKKESKVSTDLLEIEKLYLSRTISLDDGTFGFLFTKSGGSDRSQPSYQCHPCDIILRGRQEFLAHVNDSKHVAIMERGRFPRQKFSRVLEFGQKDGGTFVVPGEPVPPGMEDTIDTTCEIQTSLDDHTSSALIGLEYLVEIVNEFEPEDPTTPRVRVTYLCMLCQKKGTSFNIITHLGSPNHCLAYFRLYFPNIFIPLDKFPKVAENKEGVNSIILRIALKVEKKYGRMKPKLVSNSQMSSNDGKLAIINEINAGKHLREEKGDVEEWKKFINFKYVLRPEQLALDYPPSPPPVISKPLKSSPLPPEMYTPFGDIPFSTKKPSGPKFNRKASPDIVFEKEIGRKVYMRHSRRDSLSPVSSSTFRSRPPAGSPIDGEEVIRSRSPINRPHRKRTRSQERSINQPSRGRSGHYSGRGRGRSRSPNNRERHKRLRSGSRSPINRSRHHRRSPLRRKGSSVERVDRFGRVLRSRSPSHSRSPPHSSTKGRGLIERESIRSHRSHSGRIHESSDMESKRPASEKLKLERYKEELARIEIELLDKLKYHEKNPEQHPSYGEEWKQFWNRRYKELQGEGKDPSNYDFKPEWINFWDNRMKELFDIELLDKKKELKDTIGISSESFRIKSSVSDLKSTWHALTGSEINDNHRRSRSPRRSRTPLRSRSPRHYRSRRRSRSPRHSRSPNPSRRSRSGSMRSGSESPPWVESDIHFAPGMHRMPYPPRFSHHPMMLRGRGGVLSRMFLPRMPYPPRYLQPPPVTMLESAPPLNIITVLRTLTVLESQLESLGPKCVELLSEALHMEKVKPTSSVLLMHDENCVMFETIAEKLRAQLSTGVVKRHMINATRQGIQSIEALLFHAPKIEKPSVPENIDKEAIAVQIAAALVAEGRPDVSNEELEELIEHVISMAKSRSESTGEEVNTQSILSQFEKKPLQSLSDLPESIQSTQKIDPSTSSSLKLLQSSYEEPQTNNDNLEKLPEEEVKILLMNFKSLSKEEQMILIQYLSELQAKDPVKVKAYQKYLEIDEPSVTTLSSACKKTEAPEIGSFSKSIQMVAQVLGKTESSKPSSVVASNPSKKVSQFFIKAESNAEPISDDDDDDDNYSIEDVYKVAAAKVEEKEKLEKPPAVSIETNPNSSQNTSVGEIDMSEASNILNWIKNNATENPDVLKNLLGNSSNSTDTAANVPVIKPQPDVDPPLPTEPIQSQVTPSMPQVTLNPPVAVGPVQEEPFFVQGVSSSFPGMTSYPPENMAPPFVPMPQLSTAIMNPNQMVTPGMMPYPHMHTMSLPTGVPGPSYVVNPSQPQPPGQYYDGNFSGGSNNFGANTSNNVLSNSSLEPDRNKFSSNSNYEPDRNNFSSNSNYEPDRNSFSSNSNYEPDRNNFSSNFNYEPDRNSFSSNSNYELDRNNFSSNSNYKPDRNNFSSNSNYDTNSYVGNSHNKFNASSQNNYNQNDNWESNLSNERGKRGGRNKRFGRNRF